MLIVVAGFSMHKQTNVSTKLPWKWNVPAQQMLSPFCKRSPESQRRREAQACHATSSVVAVALVLCVRVSSAAAVLVVLALLGCLISLHQCSCMCAFINAHCYLF